MFRVVFSHVANVANGPRLCFDIGLEAPLGRRRGDCRALPSLRDGTARLSRYLLRQRRTLDAAEALERGVAAARPALSDQLTEV